MSRLIDKREFLRLLGSAVVAAPTAIVTTRALQKDATTDKSPKRETAYERVMRTSVLRCGYALYEPLLGIDINTGSMHGVFYDLMNEIGKELDLKIEWSAEVGYGEIEEGFLANKYDAFCNGVTFTPKRAKFSLSTVPVYYNDFVIWVRADDHRFDEGMEKLNSPEVKLSVRDGDVNESIALKKFPKAKRVSVPQIVDDAQMLVEVQTGKADAAFFEKAFGYKYMAKNPGKIRPLFLDAPVDSNAVGMMLPIGEVQLKNMIDTVLTSFSLNGVTKSLIEKNAGAEYNYWRIRTP